MTKIKLCGLNRLKDIEVVNELKPDYIGFVFAKKSSRYISFDKAKGLKDALDPSIKAVGVFVDEDIEVILNLFNDGIIDCAQLHGHEDNSIIDQLKFMSQKTIIKAFKIETREDVIHAQASHADYILLDSKNGGSGTKFDWTLIKEIKRDYFLAGGLFSENIAGAIETLQPYGVDVSSGIETDGVKDEFKMIEFVKKVRSIAI